MRRIVGFGSLVAVLSMSAGAVGGQTTRLATNAATPVAALLDRDARLQADNQPLTAALTQLESAAGVTLAYSPSLLPSDLRVSCACAGVSVGEALAILLVRTGITFTEEGGQIVLVPRRGWADEGRPVQRRVPALAESALEPRRTSSRSADRAPSALFVPATITGRVTSEGGAPISGALVSLPSLQLSTTSSDAGIFRLIVPENRVVDRTDTLRVTRIGYAAVKVPFSLQQGTIRVDVVLHTQAVALAEVLVTGTAGNQERRAQPAVVASINASELMNKAPVLNANEMLTARTPGVSLTTSSGTAGANTRINIRGQASISLSNYPLIFVDGVRVSGGPRGIATVPGGTTAGAGGQQLNALNDINPNDIESIEVVKGPAAATLYGADASAGVIQIITKKGRAGSRQLTQNASVSYDMIRPNFVPPSNYAKCGAANVAPTSANPLCRGQAVGTIVSDNVLVRNGVFNDGWSNSLQYSARGGGEGFGYFASVGGDNTSGTVPGNFLNHRTGRVNVNWAANSTTSLNVGMGMFRADDRLPQGDQSSYSYMVGGVLASPLSVRSGPDGALQGGWFMANESVEMIRSILTQDATTRVTPTVRLDFAPVSWFTHRITVGADLSRTTAMQMYPKNDKGWYTTTLNTGVVTRIEDHLSIYTVDYLGNISHKFGGDGWLSSDLSVGSQWIQTTSDLLSGSGTGLLTNTANAISAATTTTGAQSYAQSKSLGYFVQEQLGMRDRLFVQLGARIDRNSAFGTKVGSFFLPKAGVSYVMSQEPFWRERLPWFSTLRLRAAYGTTGRSPSGVAALQTYVGANYVTDAGVVLPGVSLGSPGNPDLKPERGVEVEGGFDAGFFDDRLGLEVTYFNKSSKDLLLAQPLAPSAGFATNPLVNIGEVTNKGVEVGLRATPVDRANVTWEVTTNVSTLANKIVSMGSITPFVSAGNQCFKPGIEVAGWCVPRVLNVDEAKNVATVSDTAEFVGGQLPKTEGSFSTTITLLRNLRLYGLLDGKWGYKVYNLTRDFRDRALANSAEGVLPPDQGGYSSYERLRRFGPFVTQTTGQTVGRALVRDPYIVPGDFVRFRELSATVSLPASLTARYGIANSSITIGAKNLALWSKYDGYDPEVFGVIDQVTPNLSDVFTTPPSRRLFTRFSVQF
jgi:TonB-linked SusC/RagA family outer membrane protein